MAEAVKKSDSTAMIAVTNTTSRVLSFYRYLPIVDKSQNDRGNPTEHATLLPGMTLLDAKTFEWVSADKAFCRLMDEGYITVVQSPTTEQLAASITASTSVPWLRQLERGGDSKLAPAARRRLDAIRSAGQTAAQAQQAGV